MADRVHLERLTKKLADDGRLLEAGWVSLRLAAISLSAPAIQLQEMRLAYMSGAQHLFASMMGMLDPGPDETPADMRRMELIQIELNDFTKELELWVAKTKGSG